MPSSALLQALDRLDHAVSRAEQALDHRVAHDGDTSEARDKAIRDAIAEIDELVVSLGGGANG